MNKDPIPRLKKKQSLTEKQLANERKERRQHLLLGGSALMMGSTVISMVPTTIPAILNAAQLSQPMVVALTVGTASALSGMMMKALMGYTQSKTREARLIEDQDRVAHQIERGKALAQKQAKVMNETAHEILPNIESDTVNLQPAGPSPSGVSSHPLPSPS